MERTSVTSGGGPLLEVVDAGEKRDLITTRDRENAHYLLVLNKCDLPRHADWNDSDAVAISCHERAARELTRAIGEVVAWSGELGQEAVAVNARHQGCLRRSREEVTSRPAESGREPWICRCGPSDFPRSHRRGCREVETEELLGRFSGVSAW